MGLRLRSRFLVALYGGASALIGFLAVIAAWWRDTDLPWSTSPWVPFTVWGCLVGVHAATSRPRVALPAAVVAGVGSYAGAIVGTFFEIMRHGTGT